MFIINQKYILQRNKGFEKETTNSLLSISYIRWEKKIKVSEKKVVF